MGIHGKAAGSAQVSAFQNGVDLAQVKTGMDVQNKRVSAKQDSVASTLMMELERRYFETQSRKEQAQNMATVYFDYNGAELSANDLTRIAPTGKELAADANRKITLQVFSDESAGASSNERMRRNREKAVRAALMANGASKSQIELVEWTGAFTGFDRFDRRAEIKRLY